ncbi:AAA family ATPase [Paenibacillus thermoaerophilus]|uniref:AAA family ATPase n=1 Tax=Paenibacillus thermoaerophilus TaxID=1215385 RepID=A0ABW2V189_9BACL|nr:MoxR family ATPase [Paenibacillus thermoaerophilus]TMV18960.1 MoxR family ATPase [Paenibacillus thermoaerophilus]
MDAVAQEAVWAAGRLKTNLESCILGKSSEIELLLTALLSGGHVLLEDVPGTGKTVLVKALAKSVNGQFRRIQCNPDLLPTDITGVSIYHPKQESFVFRPGPVMTNLLLVDEINRATTKTQSALLEAMEERSISADGENYPLPSPFLLIATQNPIDFEGTYPLPEAQLDRFLMKLRLGYPDHETEKQMLRDQAEQHPVERLAPVMDIEGLLALQQAVRQVHIDEAVSDYLVTIVQETRRHRSLALGASPRATLGLLAASKSLALLRGRDYVIPDDIKYLTPYVLSHRLLLQTDARLDGQTAESVLEQLLQGIRVPIRLEK